MSNDPILDCTSLKNATPNEVCYKNVKYLVKFNQVYHTDINPNYPIRVIYSCNKNIISE